MTDRSIAIINELIEIKNNRNPEWAVDQFVELLIDQLAKDEDYILNTKLLLEVIEKNIELHEMLKSRLSEIERLSVTDVLTQLFNRKKITDEIRHQMDLFERFETPVSVILFDIDHFKSVNDTFGHNMGDEVLKTVARIAKESIRKVDFAGRWGGEEFILILCDTGLDGAAIVAEKLRQRYENEQFPHGEKLTSSFGVSTAIAGDRLETIVDRADQGLYEAKRTGRNRVCVFGGQSF